LMALARHVPKATASLKGGKWERSKLVGVEVRNKVLGVIGLGKGTDSHPLGTDVTPVNELQSQMTSAN